MALKIWISSPAWGKVDFEDAVGGIGVNGQAEFGFLWSGDSDYFIQNINDFENNLIHHFN